MEFDFNNPFDFFVGKEKLFTLAESRRWVRDYFEFCPRPVRRELATHFLRELIPALKIRHFMMNTEHHQVFVYTDMVEFYKHYQRIPGTENLEIRVGGLENFMSLATDGQPMDDLGRIWNQLRNLITTPEWIEPGDSIQTTPQNRDRTRDRASSAGDRSFHQTLVNTLWRHAPEAMLGVQLTCFQVYVYSRVIIALVNPYVTVNDNMDIHDAHKPAICFHDCQCQPEEFADVIADVHVLEQRMSIEAIDFLKDRFVLEGMMLPWTEWAAAQHRCRQCAITVSNVGNVTARRALMTAYGPSTFLTDIGATLLDESRYGKLYRWNTGDAFRPLAEVYVCVTDATVHEGKLLPEEYMLRVPPEMETAHEAVAWTFRMTTDQYDKRILRES